MSSNLFNLILGYVQDYSDHPIPEASITVLEKNISVYADKTGKYGVALSPGNYTVRYEARGYHPNVKLVYLNDITNFPKVVMVKLRIDSSFYGIPRLPFVFIIGISLFILIILYFICFCLGFICAGILGLGMACYVACRKKNEYGLISQQSFYEDFKYDLTVDSKEREIFRTPLSKYFLTINLLFPAVIDFYYSSFEITIIFHINNYFLT